MLRATLSAQVISALRKAQLKDEEIQELIQKIINEDRPDVFKGLRLIRDLKNNVLHIQDPSIQINPFRIGKNGELVEVTLEDVGAPKLPIAPVRSELRAKRFELSPEGRLVIPRRELRQILQPATEDEGLKEALLSNLELCREISHNKRKTFSEFLDT